MAATRFNSIGRDLFELGNIKHELALIENERKKRLLALQSSHHGSSASEEKDGDTNEHKRISMRKVFAKVYRLARRFGRVSSSQLLRIGFFTIFLVGICDWSLHSCGVFHCPCRLQSSEGKED